MQLRLPYGDGVVSAELTRGRCLGALDVASVPAVPNPAQAVRTAIEHPIALDFGLADLVRPGDSVAILVSDQFRDTGADVILPVALDVLNGAGIPDDAVVVMFAT
ncbi:MAG TPA: DUF2088 domain-containing protein, partial [Candidatus Hydrogenedentes bacterium]|nr:DUF2088 domain-containing protein [Candidatus Hydrogenedentota bacterium]